VRKLHVDRRLDRSVIHGNGTTTAAKKGGDNLGYSGHKHLKGDKVVAFCDRDCNIISQFIAAAGNRNKSSLLRDALPKLSENARAIGIDLRGSTLSLVGVYGCRGNRKSIFNLNMRPNVPENRRAVKHRSEAANGTSTRRSSRSAFALPSACSPGKTPISGLVSSERNNTRDCLSSRFSIPCPNAVAERARFFTSSAATDRPRHPSIRTCPF